MLADKAVVALTALKRLESDSLAVREGTRDAVRRALEAGDIHFISSARGEGVMLVRPDTKPDARAPAIGGSGGRDHDQAEPGPTGRG